MKLFKKPLLAAALSLGILAFAPVNTVKAATATTTIEIDFPTILILYTFQEIDLAVSTTGLAAAITAGVTSCVDPDFCSDEGTSDLTSTPLDLDGADSLDADIGSGVAALPAPIAVTIQNAFGMRCLGCTTYTAGVVDGGTTDAIDDFVVLTPIAANGLTLVTEDLDFTIDLSSADISATTNVTESVTFTVTANP